ncbi:hypothetical protein ACFOWZ_00225 [Lentzea rhizosphaerae]|uniref:Major facilitator superfamily (MFS) profile domain-containing protein n=1 Tax=Lentzea rhizosphaerae TaxID=2041025 RepID=A0ABV8BJ43_9PSEU
MLVGLLLDNAGAAVLGAVFAVGVVIASVPLLRMTTAAAAVPVVADAVSSS